MIRVIRSLGRRCGAVLPRLLNCKKRLSLAALVIRRGRSMKGRDRQAVVLAPIPLRHKDRVISKLSHVVGSKACIGQIPWQIAEGHNVLVGGFLGQMAQSHALVVMKTKDCRECHRHLVIAKYKICSAPRFRKIHVS